MLQASVLRWMEGLVFLGFDFVEHFLVKIHL
jgi:hypothetical protein